MGRHGARADRAGRRPLAVAAAFVNRPRPAAVVAALVRRQRPLSVVAAVLLTAALGAGIRVAVAQDGTETDMLAVMAKVPNDQGPGACDLAAASALRSSSRTATRTPTAKPSATASARRSAQAKSSGKASAKPSGSAGTELRALAETSATPDANSPTEDPVATGAAPADCPKVGANPPGPEDFVDIGDVQPNVAQPENGDGASKGTFTSLCGTNANSHRNADDFIVAAGARGGVRHLHDYVGNRSTDANSTQESLLAAGTTCAGGDKSTYFWPVLRDTGKAGGDADSAGGGVDGNVGAVLAPKSVEVTFHGNARSEVTAMPTFLRMITGDAKAASNGSANARAAWTCTGVTDRTTSKYPTCPQGSAVQRILDFPSCWDGKNTDSANHRSHVVFPKRDGSCWADTVAIPQLRITLTYQVPDNSTIALDSFPDQAHDSATDHADFANLMPAELMTTAVSCINAGLTCDSNSESVAQPVGVPEIAQPLAPGNGAADPAPDNGGPAPTQPAAARPAPGGTPTAAPAGGEPPAGQPDPAGGAAPNAGGVPAPGVAGGGSAPPAAGSDIAGEVVPEAAGPAGGAAAGTGETPQAAAGPQTVRQAAEAQAADDGAGAESELSFTGNSTLLYGGLAIALVSLGVWMVSARRRQNDEVITIGGTGPDPVRHRSSYRD